MKKKKSKSRKNIILPLYCTNPIAIGEKGGEKTLEDAVEMARKWVEENKI